MLVALTYADDDDCYCEMNGIEVDDDDCGCDGDSGESDEVHHHQKGIIAHHKLSSNSGLLWETDRKSMYSLFHFLKQLHKKQHRPNFSLCIFCYLVTCSADTGLDGTLTPKNLCSRASFNGTYSICHKFDRLRNRMYCSKFTKIGA